MNRRSIVPAFAIFAGMLCAACSHSPGRPAAGSQVIPPSQVMDFNTLYARNCAACHGGGPGQNRGFFGQSRLPRLRRCRHSPARSLTA
jgi:hypothetical protein